MSAIRKLGSALGLVAVLALSACATHNVPVRTAATPAKFYSGIGVVQSIAFVRPETATSRTAENEAGQKSTAYKFAIHMDDDSDQTIVQDSSGGFAVGDCVQVQGRNLQRCGHKLGE